MDRQLSLNRAETFSFVNPWIRYFLFFFSFLFWVSRIATNPFNVHIQDQCGHFKMQFLVTHRELQHKRGASSPPWVYFWFGTVLYIYTYIWTSRLLMQHWSLGLVAHSYQTLLTQPTPDTPARLVVSHNDLFFFPTAFRLHSGFTTPGCTLTNKQTGKVPCLEETINK